MVNNYRFSISMKYSLFTFVFTIMSLCTWAQTPCVDGMAGTYPCLNVDLMAFIPLEDIGDGENTNDIWGWVSPVTGREYALVGCSNGTAFLDISSPASPIYIGFLPTHTDENLWRDLESDERYCYIGSEAPDHGLQIFDLYQLDLVSNGPVEFEETAHFDAFGSSHTITLDPINHFVYCNGSRDLEGEFVYEGGLYIVDVSDPLNPTLAGGFAEDGYTHDSFLWNYDGPDADYQGKQMVIACNGGSLTFVDCTDKLDCQMISTLVYPDLGYVHQGWITKDKKHFLLDDELDEVALGNDLLPYGTRTHIFNIEDLDNVVYMGFYENDNLAIDHNLYVKDQFVYQSNYRSGVRIVDAVKVSQGILKEVGYFDLFPQNDNAQFSGTWSNYPYLPSGLNIATSMYEGFFILQPRVLYAEQTDWDLCLVDQIQYTAVINGDIAFPVVATVSGIPGALMTPVTIEGPGSYSFLISGLSTLVPGDYNGKVKLTTTFSEQYELELNLSINASSPATPVLVNPLNDGFIDVNAPSIVISWEGSSAGMYEVEVATDAAFMEIVETQTVATLTAVFNYNLPLGSYFVRVRALNDCGQSAWSTAHEFTVVEVAVHEIAMPLLAAWPNPFTNAIELRANGPLGTIRAIDALGQVVYNQSTAATNIRLTNVEWPSGIYFIQTNQGSQRVVRK
jgi:choice-of-anchor B domain-containing protein